MAFIAAGPRQLLGQLVLELFGLLLLVLGLLLLGLELRLLRLQVRRLDPGLGRLLFELLLVLPEREGLECGGAGRARQRLSLLAERHRLRADLARLPRDLLRPTLVRLARLADLGELGSKLRLA